MDSSYLQLDFILNIENFERIQDSIADVTNLAIITVDYRGTPVTKHSRCSEFCKAVRSNINYLALCEKCDSRGGLEAVRLQKPYIYLCHMGVLDLAIPIIINKQYFGAVMAGQVLINDEEKDQLEQIVSKKEIVDDSHLTRQLSSLYKQLPVMSIEKVKAIADMIFTINHYIVEDAYMKISLNEINNSIASLDISRLGFKNNKQKQSFDNEEKNKDKMTDQVLDSELDLGEDRDTKKVGLILKPAMEYIQENFTKKIKLSEAASLCNVSISYFSKLFKKVVGHNFAAYINNLRVKLAKELLEKSDIPITNIAIELGFEDSGYFSKVFKQIVGVTPSEFRNMENSINKK